MERSRAGPAEIAADEHERICLARVGHDRERDIGKEVGRIRAFKGFHIEVNPGRDNLLANQRAIARQKCREGRANRGKREGGRLGRGASCDSDKARDTAHHEKILGRFSSKTWFDHVPY